MKRLNKTGGIRLPQNLEVLYDAEGGVSRLLFDRVAVRLADLQTIIQREYGRVPLITSMKFNLCGQVAGLCRYTPYFTESGFELEFNPILLKENLEVFIRGTVAHEYAHAVNGLFGERGHGHGWKQVMGLFGVSPNRCHCYDLSNCKVRRVRVVPYRCACQSVDFTMVRHNRVLKGATYRCKLCHSVFRQE